MNVRTRRNTRTRKRDISASESIRRWMDQEGWSLTDLSLETNIALPQLMRLLKATKPNPTLRTMSAIARATGLSLDIWLS